MKDLVERIAQSLVDHPNQVEVSEIDLATVRIFELKVAREDIGKVIGKHGRNVEAFQILLTAAGKKLKKRVVLEIIK